MAAIRTLSAVPDPDGDLATVGPEKVIGWLAIADHLHLHPRGREYNGIARWVEGCNSKDVENGEEQCYEVAGHANPEVADHRHVEVDFFSLMRGEKPSVAPNHIQVEIAYHALLRGCKVFAESEDTANGKTCASLGGLLFAIGNLRAAAAVWQSAPGCYSYDRGVPVNRCMALALAHQDVYETEPQVLVQMARNSCTTIHDRASCEFLAGKGLHVDMSAVEQAEADRHEEIQEYKERRQAKIESEEAESDATLDAILGALAALPGASTGQFAILEEGNRQAAAIRAIGAAHAAQTAVARASAAQALAASTNALASALAAPTRASNASTGVAAAYTPASGGTDEVSAPHAAGPAYVSALPASCVRQFWDQQAYNWLSFANDCGQTIELTFIFAHAQGWAMTGSMTLTPGAHENTGRSSSDITSAGGFVLYVCPENTVPTDQNGNALQNIQVTQYRCKVQQ